MLTRLFCRDFRNLEELSWEPSAGLHLVLGENGAGKTSLLEAVYILATTRSFRTSRLSDCCRHGANELLLGGTAEVGARSDLEFGLGEQGVYRRLNGGSSPLADHLTALPVVSWTAADGEWIGGAPAARRRLMDQGIVARRPAALAVRSRYRQALDQKRELLARGGQDLAPWNEVLAQAAAELIRLRRDYVEELRRHLEEVLAVSELELPSIRIRYRPSPAVGGEGAEATLEAIERSRSRELDRRTPLVGPHRDELEIAWGDHAARRVASAGESKLVGLAITAARARLLETAGRRPLLLLDDLDAELDSRRLAAVWSFFTPFRQLFVTSSREAAWDDLEADSRWSVACGKVASERSMRGSRS